MKKNVHGPLSKSNNTPVIALNYEPPRDNGLNIIYNDQHLIVVSKPSGLLSVPGNRDDLKDSLETRVRKQFPNATTVHRLDRGTSGVFIMALNKQAHRSLGLQFEKRQTEKTYLAVTEGLVAENSGKIDKPMRTDWYNRPTQMIDSYFGKEAVTYWSVKKRMVDTTLMELKPVTGRSHQIRVHMQWLGHPILGDDFYATSERSHHTKRLMLHAAKLVLKHPDSGKLMIFSDPIDWNEDSEKI